MNHFTTISLLALTAVVVACAQQPQQQQRQPSSSDNAEQLEGQVQSGRAIEATVALHKRAVLDPSELLWLHQRARQGVPPLQYELARRIQQRAIPGSFIEWYAKAYVLRSLDGTQCSKRALNPGDMAIRTMYAPLFDAALADPVAYASELERALEWEGKRAIKPSPAWVCGSDLLSTSEGLLAKEKQAAEIRLGIERLRARKK